MFNSIRKDKNRRDLVKKFEIQRLQNKVLFQATSALESRVSLNVTLINNNFVFVKNRQKQEHKAKLCVELRKKVLQSKSVNNTPNDFFFQALQNNSVFQNNSDWQKKIFKETPLSSSKNRVQNRCIETGRSRAVLRFCKLSRICLRDKASKGLISGVSKASW